jgi:RimJ/RimL family protein N-acetyltransferase
VPTDGRRAGATTHGDVVPAPPETISTARLELVPMSLEFMEALRARDLDAAEQAIGATVSAWMAEELEDFVQYRLSQLAADPTIGQWLGRAMVLTDNAGRRHAIGSIGFHGPPEALGRLEVGYSVQPEYRRRGYAMESVRAIFDWAATRHGIKRFVASISPTNEASLRLTAQLGFREIGSHIDEIDGLELVYETTWPGAPTGSGGERSAS